MRELIEKEIEALRQETGNFNPSVWRWRDGYTLPWNGKNMAFRDVQPHLLSDESLLDFYNKILFQNHLT